MKRSSMLSFVDENPTLDRDELMKQGVELDALISMGLVCLRNTKEVSEYLSTWLLQEGEDMGIVTGYNDRGRKTFLNVPALYYNLTPKGRQVMKSLEERDKSLVVENMTESITKAVGKLGEQEESPE